MQLSGDKEQFIDWLTYARQSECHVVYFMPGGHVFFLYPDRTYLYVKTTIQASHNIKMHRISADNILRFIKRIDEDTPVAFLWIHPLEVKVQFMDGRCETDEVSFYKEWQTFTYLERDSMYSELSGKLKLLTFSEKESGFPTLRFNRKVLRMLDGALKQNRDEFLEPFYPASYVYNRKRTGINLVSIEGNRLYVRRRMKKNRLEVLRFKEGFDAISKVGDRRFLLTDDMMYLANVTRHVDDSDFLYLVETEDAYVIEVHKRLLHMKMSVPKDLAWKR